MPESLYPHCAFVNDRLAYSLFVRYDLQPVEETAGGSIAFGLSRAAGRLKITSLALVFSQAFAGSQKTT